MTAEKKEKRILFISFGAGLVFALIEFGFAIYSHSQSVLMDAAFDASELVFIIFILFLNPLFHKPISEKRPYGFSQIESIFLIIKGVMMLSVTLGLLVNIIESALLGGSQVDSGQIVWFQFILGLSSLGIFMVMRHLNHSISSPTMDVELFGWKQDVIYSFGMSFAFFASTFLNQTPFSFISPYFDQLIAIIMVICMLPKNVKILWSSIQDIFLFSPEESTVNDIKSICNEILESYAFEAVFYDITRTGRRLWVAIYFKSPEEQLVIEKLHNASSQINSILAKHYENCVCELIIASKEQIQSLNK